MIKKPNNVIPNYNNTTFSARVSKVILNDKDYPQLFDEYGKWDSLGVIFFDEIKNSEPEFIKENIAYPLLPNIKNYPLQNEIVYIFRLSSIDTQGNPSAVINYYISPLNIWNNIHHNALPNNVFPTEFKLGFTFKEKDYINTLQPYEGDIIFEGRNGNSIRFGSTTNHTLWEGTEGSPILILVNSNFTQQNDKWEPKIENINKDESSIWLTSNQKIPIEVASKSYKSYTEQPISPKEYNSNQIILNSNRIIINSKKDNILLTSIKTVNINSKKSVNIDSPKLIIDSSNIYLGNKTASEPLLLGNKTIDLLNKVLTALQELCATLPSVGTPIPYTPNTAVAQSSAKLTGLLTSLIPTLSTLKSKQNFTI